MNILQIIYILYIMGGETSEYNYLIYSDISEFEAHFANLLNDI